MKTKIFDMQYFSTGDGGGIRTTVFFSGCPLRCPWCHNPEGLLDRALFYTPSLCIGCGRCCAACPNGAHRMRQGRHEFDRSDCIGCGKCANVCPGALKNGSLVYDTAELVALATRDKQYYDRSGGGVTISGGEPLMQYDAALLLAEQLRRADVSVCLDTALGAAVNDYRQTAQAFELILADMKFADAALMQSVCGGCLDDILDRLEQLRTAGANVILRQPYIPVYHDGKQLALLRDLFARLKLPVVVLPYHRLGSGKYAALGLKYGFACEPPTEVEVAAIESYYRDAGIRIIKRNDL